MALHNKQYDYTLLKVFGGSCFLYVKPYNNNKPEFRSFKCTYLGVSLTHKGHKCLSLEGKIYISKDAVFNETEFPWNTTNSKDEFTQSKHSLILILPVTQPTQVTNLVSSSPTDKSFNTIDHHVSTGVSQNVHSPLSLSNQFPNTHISLDENTCESTFVPETLQKTHTTLGLPIVSISQSVSSESMDKFLPQATKSPSRPN